MATPTDIVSVGATIAEQPIQFGWAPTRGYFTRREWRGTETEIRALVPQVYAAGYEYIVSGGPVWTLIANINSDTSDGNNDNGQNEIPYPQFELFNQVSEKDLFESSSPFVTNLRTDLLRIVQQDCSEQRPPSFMSNNNFTEYERLYGLDVYTHYMGGAKTVKSNIPVLRKSYSISNKYNVAAQTKDGVNRIWSTSGLITTENVPFAIQALMPPSKPPYQPIDPATNKPNIYSFFLIDGWLKSDATYQQIAANRFSVNVDYTFGIWPVNIYGTFFR